jgi:transposase
MTLTDTQRRVLVVRFAEATSEDRVGILKEAGVSKTTMYKWLGRLRRGDPLLAKPTGRPGKIPHVPLGPFEQLAEAVRDNTRAVRALDGRVERALRGEGGDA